MDDSGCINYSWNSLGAEINEPNFSQFRSHMFYSMFSCYHATHGSDDGSHSKWKNSGPTQREVHSMSLLQCSDRISIHTSLLQFTLIKGNPFPSEICCYRNFCPSHDMLHSWWFFSSQLFARVQCESETPTGIVSLAWMTQWKSIKTLLVSLFQSPSVDELNSSPTKRKELFTWSFLGWIHVYLLCQDMSCLCLTYTRWIHHSMYKEKKRKFAKKDSRRRTECDVDPPDAANEEMEKKEKCHKQIVINCSSSVIQA